MNVGKNVILNHGTREDNIIMELNQDDELLLATLATNMHRISHIDSRAAHHSLLNMTVFLSY